MESVLLNSDSFRHCQTFFASTLQLSRERITSRYINDSGNILWKVKDVVGGGNFFRYFGEIYGLLILHEALASSRQVPLARSLQLGQTEQTAWACVFGDHVIHFSLLPVSAHNSLSRRHANESSRMVENDETNGKDRTSLWTFFSNGSSRLTLIKPIEFIRT